MQQWRLMTHDPSHLLCCAMLCLMPNSMKLMDEREVLKSRSLMMCYHIVSFCIITLIFLTTISTHMCFFIYYVLSHISGVHGPSLDLFSFIAIGRSSDKMGWPSLSCDRRRMDPLSRCSRSYIEMVMKWLEFVRRFRRCPPSHNFCLCCLDVFLTLNETWIWIDMMRLEKHTSSAWTVLDSVGFFPQVTLKTISGKKKHWTEKVNSLFFMCWWSGCMVSAWCEIFWVKPVEPLTCEAELRACAQPCATASPASIETAWQQQEGRRDLFMLDFGVYLWW